MSNVFACMTIREKEYERKLSVCCVCGCVSMVCERKREGFENRSMVNISLINYLVKIISFNRKLRITIYILQCKEKKTEEFSIILPIRNVYTLLIEILFYTLYKNKRLTIILLPRTNILTRSRNTNLK